VISWFKCNLFHYTEVIAGDDDGFDGGLDGGFRGGAGGGSGGVGSGSGRATVDCRGGGMYKMNAGGLTS
jgi:hypothetical protein